MVTAPDHEKLRNDLLDLLRGLDFYRAWRLAGIERNTGQLTQEDINSVVMPGSWFLSVFDQSKGRQRVEILTHVQNWYGHAAGELSHIANEDGETSQNEVGNFLEAFRQNVGFDFHARSGALERAVRKTLAAGTVANSSDYYSLRELEEDMSQGIVSAQDMQELSKVLRAFENRTNDV